MSKCDKKHRFYSSIWNTFGLKRSELTDLYMKDIKYLQSISNEDDEPFFKKNEFTLGTWNVHGFRDPKNRFISVNSLESFIEQDLRANVLCLQEYPIQENDQIKDEIVQDVKDFYDLKYEFRDRSCYLETKYNSTIANVALSKFPIKSIYEKTFNAIGSSKEERCFTISQVFINKKLKVRVINTHLDVWDGSGIVRENQIKELLNVYSILKKDCPTFLCGDFNTTKKEKTYPSNVWKGIITRYYDYYKQFDKGKVFDLLEQSGFISVFELTNQLNPTFTTWNGTTVDWIFVDKNTTEFIDLKTLCCKFHPTLLSDHSALTCSFSFTE